jgi:hypothetical protein
MKLCPKCNETKNHSEFRWRKPNAKGVSYAHPYCIPCTRVDQRERRANGYSYKSKKTTAEGTRTSWLRLLRLKGITEEDYLRMLVEQNGTCKICKKETPWSRSDKWHVDHCHETGKVRGLLCINCNRGLGLFQDDTGLLKEAIQYLENSRLPDNPDTA